MINQPRPSIWAVVANARSPEGNTTNEITELIAEYIYCIHGEDLVPQPPKDRDEVKLMVRAYQEVLPFFEHYMYP